MGKDCKVAFDRAEGKKPTALGVEFGEKLLYKVKPTNKMEKINARWEHGFLVGVRRRSGELWVAVKDKVLSVKTVRRIPVEQRWGAGAAFHGLTGPHGIGIRKHWMLMERCQKV